MSSAICCGAALHLRSKAYARPVDVCANAGGVALLLTPVVVCTVAAATPSLTLNLPMLWSRPLGLMLQSELLQRLQPTACIDDYLATIKATDRAAKIRDWLQDDPTFGHEDSCVS